jgi:hypothetical protein
MIILRLRGWSPFIQTRKTSRFTQSIFYVTSLLLFAFFIFPVPKSKKSIAPLDKNSFAIFIHGKKKRQQLR